MPRRLDVVARPEPLKMSSLEQILARLAGTERHDSLVVSCYIRLGPQERGEKKYLSEINSRIHELQPTIEATVSSHEQRESLKRDLARVSEYCNRPSSMPSGGGIAIFASEPDGLFEVFALPHVNRFHLVIDRTPFVLPLIAIQNQIGRNVAVVFDRARARIFEVTAFDAREIVDLTASSMRGSRYHSDRQGAPGWGEHTYNNRIETEKERHFQAITEHLIDMDRDRPISGFALFGQGPAPRVLAPFLPALLSRRLVGTGRLNPKTATPAQVHESTIGLVIEHTKASARKVTGEHAEALGDGMAANGVRDTLEALFRGQVRELIVIDGAAVSGYRCRESGRLVVSTDDCFGETAIDPAPYLIDDTIEEALRQGLTVTHVPKDDAGSVDMIGAFLRFR